MGKINGIRTSKGVAKIASRKLKDDRSGNQTKKLAGSTLRNRAKETR